MISETLTRAEQIARLNDRARGGDEFGRKRAVLRHQSSLNLIVATA